MTKSILTSVLLLVFGLLGNVKAQYTTDNSIVYNLFRQNEFQFPRPKPLDTIDVGRYNYSTRTFTGLTPIAVPNGHGGSASSPYNVKSECFKHILKFRVDNFTGTYIMTVNGKPFHSLTGGTDIFIPVDQTPHVEWKITFGGESYSNVFNIVRIPFYAAGAFTIPIVPILVVYEPPRDEASQNFAEYDETKYLNSSFGMSFSTENTSTQPAELSTFDNFTNYLNVAAGSLSGSSNPKAKIAGVALTILSRALGQHSVTSTDGTIRGNEFTLQTQAIETQRYNTSPNNGGPGIGDNLVCLIRPRFLWEVIDDKIYTTLLDYQEKQMISASAVKDSISRGQEREIYTSIAPYDPFITGGANCSLNPERFIFQEEINLAGTGASTGYLMGHQITISDKNNGIKFNTTTDDMTAGMLAFTGWISNTEDHKLTTTVTSTFTREVDTGTTVTATVSLSGATGENKVYDIYYDNLFGTFAVTEAHNSFSTPTQTGLIRDQQGNPQSNVPVSIKVGKVKYVTYTDKYGNYKFYSPALKGLTVIPELDGSTNKVKKALVNGGLH